MKTITVLFVVIPVFLFGQYQAENGIIYSPGDTVYLTSPADGDQYAALFRIKGLNVQYFGMEMNDTPLILKKIVQNGVYKASEGFTNFKCVTPKGDRVNLFIDQAIKLCEIQQCQKFEPSREIPPDYEAFQFQGSFWGDSKEKVITRNGAPILDENGTITYETEVGKLSGYLFYFFHNDKLFRCAYNFQDKHSTKNLYIEDYLYVKKLLDEKYGEEKMEMNWRNELYKSDIEDYGMAVSVGHLTLTTKYELPDTDILLKLTGDNYTIQHVLVYDQYPQVEQSNEKPLNKL